MIGRRPWTPFEGGKGDGGAHGEPEEPHEDDEDDELLGEALPVDGGLVAQEPQPADPLAPPPKVDPEYHYHPDGPRAPQRGPRGRILPGSSPSPPHMIRPGGVQLQPDGSFAPVSRWTHGARGHAHQERKRLPFASAEIDHAIADRLRERLDIEESQAMDRLTLFARRVVSDALAGRQYAAEALLDRLQPDPHAQAKRAGEADGIVLVTQVVGPGGADGAPRVYDIRTGFEHETEEDDS